MHGFRIFLAIVLFLASGAWMLANDFKMFAGIESRGTDSIYDSKLYEEGSGLKEQRFYGYEGYLGGNIGVEYFFSKKNGIRAFLGLGYANLKVSNDLNKFDLFSGIATKVEADYLFNYYSDEKFDFGLFGGLSYFNAYYKRASENIITNQVLANVGLNMTINSKHRIEIGLGIPFFSKGRYNSQDYKNIAITRQFKNLYYGISYMFLFDL